MPSYNEPTKIGRVTPRKENVQFSCEMAVLLSLSLSLNLMCTLVYVWVAFFLVAYIAKLCLRELRIHSSATLYTSYPILDN